MYAHRCIQLLKELKWTQSQVFGKLTALEGVVKIRPLTGLDGALSTQLFVLMHGARTDAPSQEMFPGRGGHTARRYTWDFVIAFTLTGCVFFFFTMNKEVRG